MSFSRTESSATVVRNDVADEKKNVVKTTRSIRVCASRVDDAILFYINVVSNRPLPTVRFV
jgi:hypothetical protein